MSPEFATPIQSYPAFLLWVQRVTRELLSPGGQSRPLPTLLPWLRLRRWCPDGGASTPGQPAGFSATQDHGDKCLFTSITCSCWLVERRKLMGPRTIAWEGSHLHFLTDWLPVGEKPEPHVSAKWFLHRTPLSRTVPSFNLPLYKQNNENFPPRSWLYGPPRSFLTGSRLPGRFVQCTSWQQLTVC